MSQSETTDYTAIGAIRLAMEAGSTDRDKLALIEELLKRAPQTQPDDTSSVAELMTVAHALKARFEIRA